MFEEIMRGGEYWCTFGDSKRFVLLVLVYCVFLQNCFVVLEYSVLQFLPTMHGSIGHAATIQL